MSGLSFSPVNHRCGDSDARITVELDDDHNVSVTLESDGMPDDAKTWRTLAPDEARAFAAALIHYANEADR